MAAPRETVSAILARLKHDPMAPSQRVSCVIQLTGGSGLSGTCRGFVRTLRTCKYAGSCRYSHELQLLSDFDLAWAATSRQASGEKVSISRLAPLSRVAQLVDAGAIEPSALVHVLVAGEGTAGLGGLSAPHRHMWSAFASKSMWEEGGTPSADGGGSGDGGDGGGGGGDFSGLAAFLVPPPGATLQLFAPASGGSSLPAGISPTLTGLPQLALACVTSFLPDSALLPLRVTCSDMAAQLDDVSVWLPRLKRLPAWAGWAARNAAVLAPPARDAGPLAPRQWGSALRRSYFSVAASCEWAAGLRFLREALVLRALVHVPPPRPAAGSALGSGSGVRWRLPSVDLNTPPAAAPPPPPPVLQLEAPPEGAASSSPAPSPSPSQMSLTDSRPTSPVAFVEKEGAGGSSGAGGGGGGGGSGGGKKGGAGKRRGAGGGREKGGGGISSNSSSARKAGRVKQRAYSAASEEDARDVGAQSDASTGSRGSRRASRRGGEIKVAASLPSRGSETKVVASLQSSGGLAPASPPPPLRLSGASLRGDGGGGGGSPRGSAVSLALLAASEKPAPMPGAGAIARQVAGALWHLRTASCGAPGSYAPAVSALTARLLSCLTHAPPAPSSCRIAAETLSEVLLAFAEGRPCPEDAVEECRGGGALAGGTDAPGGSPLLYGAAFAHYAVDASAALCAPVPPRSALYFAAAGLSWCDADAGVGSGADAPAGGGGGGAGSGVATSFAAAAGSSGSPSGGGSGGGGGLAVVLGGHGTLIRGGQAITALASGLAAPILALAADRGRLAVIDRSGALRVYGTDGSRIAAGRASGLAGSGGGGGDAGRCCSHVCSLAFCDTALVTGHPDGSVIVSQLGQGQSIRPGTVVRFEVGEAGGGGGGRRSAAPAAHTTVALLDHSSSVLCGRRLLRGDAAPPSTALLSLHCAESGAQQRLLRPGGALRGGGGGGAPAPVDAPPSSPTCLRALGESAPFLAAVGYSCGLVRLWDVRAAREASVFALWGPGVPTGAPVPDDAGCAVTHISLAGHTLVEARTCPLGADFAAEGGAPLALSSPWVRAWDTRRAALPVGRLDLGGHALRAVTGLHLGAQALLVTHAHVFQPSPVAALRLGAALPARGGDDGGARARRAPQGHWDAAGRARGLGGPPQPVRAPRADTPRLWHLMALASEGEPGQLVGGEGAAPEAAPTALSPSPPPAPARPPPRSSVDPSQVPEYAWPDGHAPDGRDGGAWPPPPHLHAPQRRGRAPPAASCGLGCTELPWGGGWGAESGSPRGEEGGEGGAQGGGGGNVDDNDDDELPPPPELWSMSSWHPTTLAMVGWLPLPSANCLAADGGVLGIGGTAEGGGGASSIFWRFSF